MMEVKNLNKTYDRRSASANQVLKDVSFTLPDTGFVCILGPSGCGKTSLLNAIGGLDRFDSGEIQIGDLKVTGYGAAAFEAERNRSFGYIFQNYYLLQNHSVAYNVYLGLHSLGLSHGEKLRRVREALTAVDMERYIRRKVSDLSGGQQQRVAIARALARRPRVIFADEPTGNLDEANTVNICTLLRRIARTSLVVMVTHEERIAQFFADRIIRLEDGAIVSSDSDWQRGSLTVDSGSTLYAGDYREETAETEQVRLRVLSEEGAEKVSLTVVALKDRIVIKLDDGRTVSCNTAKDSPALAEGRRPAMTLETLERDEDALVIPPQEQPVRTRAGQGLSVSMLFAEALSLTKGRGMQRLGAWFFMVLLTVLTVLTVGDYLTISSVDPRDFVRTDSHILDVQLERGTSLDKTTVTLNSTVQEYLNDFYTDDAAVTVLPYVTVRPRLSVEVFPQYSDLYVELENFSYVPLEYLEEGSLIMGRMPENIREIVVDRWVLDAVLREDGIIQNSISDIGFFLGKELEFPKKTYTATIVGISDGGEAALYVSLSVMSSLSGSGGAFLTLSELQQMYPGQYDDIVLTDEECLVIPRNGIAAGKVGEIITFNRINRYTVKQQLDVDSYATVVVADSQLIPILRDIAANARRMQLYCPDKASAEQLLAEERSMVRMGMLQETFVDSYADAWNAYQQASRMRVDARTIVTVTVMAVAAVMLYLLRRTQVHGRIEMLAVYRLLGIPKGKLAAIFAMESGLTFLSSALPAAAVTYLTVTVLSGVEDLAFTMVLPWQAAAAVALAILGYHLTVGLIPLLRLLRLPPAQLASRYDF